MIVTKEVKKNYDNIMCLRVDKNFNRQRNEKRTKIIKSKSNNQVKYFNISCGHYGPVTTVF